MRTSFAASSSKNVSLVATDEASHYRNLSQTHPARYGHALQDEYVRGRVHTHSIESFWSLLKRGIIGNYHKVSREVFALVFQRVYISIQQSEESGYFR